MTLSIDTKPQAYRQASHSNVVTSVAFAPDGRSLATGSWDGTAKVWDVTDGKPRLKRTLRGAWDEVEAVAFAPDGGALAGLGTGFDGAAYSVVTLWTLGAARGRSLVHQGGMIDALAFAPDGATLATGSGDSRAVTLWNVASGKARVTLADHRGPIRSVAYAPDGRTLAVSSGVVPAVATRAGLDQVGEVCLWDLTGPKPYPRARLVGHEYGIVSATFSPDGKTLATGGFDRAVKFWDVASGREGATLSGHLGWVASVSFSPDGALLATASHDRTIKLWDVGSRRELATLTGHTGSVYAVAFSPDGARLASGGLDRTVRLWDVDHALRQGFEADAAAGVRR